LNPLPEAEEFYETVKHTVLFEQPEHGIVIAGTRRDTVSRRGSIKKASMGSNT
jgi:hypothetical protein